MSAAFREIFSAQGVDDTLADPTMLVPRGGFNFVQLVGGKGLRVEPLSRAVTAREVHGPVDMILGALADLAARLAGASPRLRRAIVGTVEGHFGEPRFFRISSSAAHRIESTLVEAFDPRLTRSVAKLKVAVLGQKIVRVAIRPVQVRDSSGMTVFHSKKPFDINQLISEMNAIWLPQGNITFLLVASDPLLSVGPLPEEVGITDFFRNNKIPGADMTLFLVGRAFDTEKKKGVYGVSSRADALALIGDDGRILDPKVLAHEAGHLLGLSHDLVKDGLMNENSFKTRISLDSALKLNKTP